jgi:hypothetical protein
MWLLAILGVVLVLAAATGTLWETVSLYAAGLGIFAVMCVTVIPFCIAAGLIWVYLDIWWASRKERR